jgi:hypothetical protein
VFTEINPLHTAAKGHIHPLMNNAFFVHAFAHANLTQHLHRAHFQHASANTAFHIFAALAF